MHVRKFKPIIIIISFNGLNAQIHSKNVAYYSILVALFKCIETISYVIVGIKVSYY